MNAVDVFAQVHDVLNHPLRLGRETAVYSRKDVEKALELLIYAARDAGAAVVVERGGHLDLTDIRGAGL